MVLFCLTLLKNSFKNTPSALPSEKKIKKFQNFRCAHTSRQFLQWQWQKNDRNAQRKKKDYTENRGNYECKACHKYFMNTERLRHHLNAVKKCRPKYNANDEMMEGLKNAYQIETGKELYSCVGCNELHSLSTITKHFENKAKYLKSIGIGKKV